MLTTGEGLGTKPQLATGDFLDLLNSASTQQGGVNKILKDLCHLCILLTGTTYLRGTRGSRTGALVSRWRQVQQPGAGSMLLHHQQTKASATDAAPLFLRRFAQVYCEHFVTHGQDSNLCQPLQMLQTWVPSPHVPWRLPSIHGEDKLRFKQQQTYPACCTAGLRRESTSSPLHVSYTDHAHAPGLSAQILKGFTMPERSNSLPKTQ